MHNEFFYSCDLLLLAGYLFPSRSWLFTQIPHWGCMKCLCSLLTWEPRAELPPAPFSPTSCPFKSWTSLEWSSFAKTFCKHRWSSMPKKNFLSGTLVPWQHSRKNINKNIIDLIFQNCVSNSSAFVARWCILIATDTHDILFEKAMKMVQDARHWQVFYWLVDRFRDHIQCFFFFVFG